MEKIELTKEEKAILTALKNSEYQHNVEDNDNIEILILKELVIDTNAKFGGRIIKLSALGKEYLRRNPKLKNPSIWDDKKYIITTIISIAALIISSIAIYISVKM